MTTMRKKHHTCTQKSKSRHFNFIEITLRHGCSPVNLLDIFRTPFPKNTSGGLLLCVEYILLFDSSSSDEKDMKTRGKTRSWLKRLERLGYFTNLVQELKMEDTQGFKEMLRMSYEDFKKLCTHKCTHNARN